MTIFLSLMNHLKLWLFSFTYSIWRHYNGKFTFDFPSPSSKDKAESFHVHNLTRLNHSIRTQKALATPSVVVPITYWTPSPTGTSGIISIANTTSITSTITPTSNTTAFYSFNSNSNLAPVIGATVSGFAALAAIGIFVWFCRRRRRRVGSSNPSMLRSFFSDESSSFLRHYKNGSATYLPPYDGPEYAAPGAPVTVAAGFTLTRTMTGRNANDDMADARKTTTARNANDDMADFGTMHSLRKTSSNTNSFIIKPYSSNSDFQIVPSPLPDSVPGSIVLTEIVTPKTEERSIELAEQEPEKEPETKVWAGFGVGEVNRTKKRQLSIIERHPDNNEGSIAQSQEVQHANYSVDHSSY